MKKRSDCLALVVLLTFLARQHTGADEIEFNRDIRPILSENCLQCHGPDSQQRQAELRLDLEASAKQDRDGTRAIEAGNSKASELLNRIVSDDDDLRMPPPASGKRLSAKQIDLLRRWIDTGAKFEKHWSLLPPRRPATPRVDAQSRVVNPIDNFVITRLKNMGLRSSPAADRATLIRRVSIDLTGLPPRPSDVAAFVADRSANAYEKVVDRLLRSSRYGEQMARFWMDAARYADTNGYQYDLEREQWVWRDWVIHAMNSNMPFDQFTIEQLAGDLLPNATDQQRLATAFHRNHPITIEGGVIDEEYRTEYVVDRVVTTSTIWLGSTLLCSRCHDHKYDPFTQKDFYRFFAFFNHVPERGNNGFNPKLRVSSPLAGQQGKEIAKQLAKARRELDLLIASSKTSYADLERRHRGQAPDAWQLVKPDSAKSLGGAQFKRLPDGSLLATGKNPIKDTYVFELTADKSHIEGIRLEALKHPTLTKGSTGRGSNGNFVLSEVRVEVASVAKPKNFAPVKIAQAEADYSQKNYGVQLTIDGRVDSSGWAVDGNQKIEDRVAAFWFAKPLQSSKPLKLRITLFHEYGGSHQIGRVRLALAAKRQPLATSDIDKLLDKPPSALSKSERSRVRAFLIGKYASDELRAASKLVKDLETRQAELDRAFPPTMVMQEMTKPRDTHILLRGQYDQPREKVTAGTPTVLPPMPKGSPSNRLGLARWLVMPNHPLTSRVTVNRFWQRLFGRGIVTTTEDFGSQGAWPSHPELLDWLSVEFVENGWNVKAILKTMVMSATYQQQSRLNTEQLSRDPENIWLSRGPRFRMDAEVIRDSALFVSGQLVDRVGGPSVFPYHPSGLWQEINNRPGYSRTYKQDKGSKLYRRSLYTFWKRTVPPPSMATFDAPEREFCVVRRSRTNTPLQAFVLLHDPQFVEAARLLGQRMMREGGKTPSERIDFGFRLCMARTASAAERQALQSAYASRLQRYRRDKAAAAQLLQVGETEKDNALPSDELAAYTSIARVLLNLAEFITKN